MSLEAEAWVWYQSKSRRGSRLVLLCIANHLNKHQGEGWVCWPSVSMLMDMTCLSERGVQDALVDLVQSRELAVEIHQGKRSYYRMPLFETWIQDRGTGTMTPAETAPPQELRPATTAYTPATNSTRPPQQTAENATVPLMNRKLNRNRTVRGAHTHRARSGGSAPSTPGLFRQGAERQRKDEAAKRYANAGRGPDAGAARVRAGVQAGSAPAEGKKTPPDPEPEMTPEQRKEFAAVLREIGKQANRMDLNRAIGRPARRRK